MINTASYRVSAPHVVAAALLLIVSSFTTGTAADSYWSGSESFNLYNETLPCATAKFSQITNYTDYRLLGCDDLGPIEIGNWTNGTLFINSTSFHQGDGGITVLPGSVVTSVVIVIQWSQFNLDGPAMGSAPLWITSATLFNVTIVLNNVFSVGTRTGAEFGLYGIYLQYTAFSNSTLLLLNASFFLTSDADSNAIKFDSSPCDSSVITYTGGTIDITARQNTGLLSFSAVPVRDSAFTLRRPGCHVDLQRSSCSIIPVRGRRLRGPS
jgi:hypothetical protein